ncbi:MAG: M18 family aminopeptidase [Actinomycetota bacterium]
MAISPESRSQAQSLLDFIDASPSPWHAVGTASEQLLAKGFVRLDEGERWRLEAGGKYFTVRGGSSVVAFIVGREPMERTGFRLVGAHTDSPGLRLKPRAPQGSDGLVRLGVEVYGGPLIATFTDRDLSLAGRVNVRTAQGFETRTLKFDQPLVRLPNLAIHMNREANEQGLKLNKQTELPLLFALAREGLDADGQFRRHLGDALRVEAKDVLNWEMCAYDTQKGSFWGPDQEFIADSQLDNLSSCHAALTALLSTDYPAATCVCALFDHEEVGSESATGAGGSFVMDVLARIAASAGLDEEGRRCAAARSFFISADMAHAWHPNFPGAYEPGHRVMVNGGPVIKTNCNHRYATSAETEARFMALCEAAGVPCQQYAHRTDIGCGSTIGPIVAARLGMATVDVGSPMWAMHSIRESAGVLDHGYMIAALRAAYGS